MNREEILRQIDAEINSLQQARDLFSGRVRTKVGRNARKARLTAPKPRAVQKLGTVRKKRTISAEGRAKIAAAQKRRWAKQKQAKT